MTHLPECDTQHNGMLTCICDALRACEQRVRDEEIVRCARKVAAERRKVLEQAVAAVAACTWDKGVNSNFDAVVTTVITGAISAIRNLREEKP